MLDLNTHGIIVEVQAIDCVAEVYLNGFPLGIAGLGATTTFGRPVHEFLIDGENELALLINPGDTPATAKCPGAGGKPASGAQPPDGPLQSAMDGPDPDEEFELGFGALDDPELKSMDALDALQKGLEEKAAEAAKDRMPPPPEVPDPDPLKRVSLPPKPTARVQARLTRYPNGAMAGDPLAEPLITLTFTAADVLSQIMSGQVKFPLYVTKKENLDHFFGPMHWQNASPLTLDEPTLEEAQAFVLKILNHLQDGQTDPVVALSQARFKEVCTAYGIDPNERASVFAAIIGEESSKDSWIFEMPEDEEWSLRLCCADRLIECTNADWGPILRTVPDEENANFSYPMFIGKLSGKWLIMR